MHVWIILSVVLSVWCEDYDEENAYVERHPSRTRVVPTIGPPENDYVERHPSRTRLVPTREPPENVYSEYTTCDWEDPPNNARFFEICGNGECEVITRTDSYHGTKRITRCDPGYTLINGFETDVCENGKWSSRGHECVQCGKSPRTFDDHGAAALISNGENSLAGDFPWMAAVFMPSIGGQWTLICGGTLISPTIVLTAAHCVSVNGTKRRTETIKVGLGRLSADINVREPDSVISSTKEILLHERYIGGSRLYDLDIAFIVLEEPIQLNDLIMPACIDWSRGRKKPKQDDIGVLAGWGLANIDKFRSQNLKWTYQKYIGYQECKQIMRGSDLKFQTPDKFCADQVKGGETEHGDSGGGLTFVRDHVHYVYGIVSSKMIMNAKQLRLYTNLVDDNIHPWLQEEWRNLQAQQLQRADSRAFISCDIRGECTEDDQCPDDRRCLGNTCLDLCPRACGTNSDCRMTDHHPVCTCSAGYTGNPYNSCTDISEDSPVTKVDKELEECRWLTDFAYSQVPTSADGGLLLNDTCSIVDSQLDFEESNPIRRRELPYLGILADEEFRNRFYGVLIGTNWFLSTAFCTKPDTCHKKVKLGITDGSIRASKWRPEFDVVEKHVHPDYEGDDLHNIALFKLHPAVEFFPHIRPACLVREQQSEETEGLTLGKKDGIFVKTPVYTLPASDCAQISSTFEDQSMFCINRAQDITMYPGIPMVGPMKKPYCMYGLLGIVSFGSRQSNRVGYMRLSYYLSWIESIVFHRARQQPQARSRPQPRPQPQSRPQTQRPQHNTEPENAYTYR